jgi:hypothetical protein
MSLTFPRTDIFNSWRFVAQSFDLRSRQELARRASGRAQGVDFGPAVWMATFVTPSLSHDDCIEVLADLNSLDGVIQYFEAYDTRRPYPRFFPDGDFSGTFLVNSVGSDSKSLSLKGLPAGFVLKKGDRLSVTYGAESIKALFEVSEPTVVANSSGITAEFEVRPHLITGIAADDVVGLHKPAVHMQVAPGSVSFNDAGSLLGTVSFQATQYI